MDCKHVRTKKTTRVVKLPRDTVKYTLTHCLGCRGQVSVKTESL